MHDLRFGLRLLRRTPGFSLLVILCLSVGIGATTAVLSWIEGILLRPFPLVKHQERMVALTGTDRNGRTAVSWPDLQDLRRNCTMVQAFIAEHIGGATLAVGPRADQAVGSVVSSNYFDALGIRPILGRGFDSSEDFGRNAHPVTVISYQTWKERYKGDPSIIGRIQMLNGVKHTIVGVAPEGFSGTFVGYAFNFWVPASMEEVFEGGGYKLDNRGARWSEGFAILKPGVTIAQAQAEISAAARRLEAAYPETNRNRGIRLYPLWATPFNNAGTLLPTLRISLVVACLVLLIACANVANLLLVRSSSRRHEMTVRLAVGADGRRLLRQLLTEGSLFALAAAGGGLLLAHWSRDLIWLLFPPMPSGISSNLPAEMDWRVLALSAVVCQIATVLFSLVPAMQAGRIDLSAAMKSESVSILGGRRKAWIRSSLVIVQVSLSFILLTGATLLLKSLHAMRETDVGFATRDGLVGAVDMTGAGYQKAQVLNFQEQFNARLQGVSGIQSVVWSRSVPFSYRGYPSSAVMMDGFVPEPGDRPVVEYNEAGPAYLATTGVPLVAGRDFTRADNESSQPVAIVNENMVQRFWRGENPLGSRLQVNGRWLRVVGVAKNSRYSSLLESAKPFFYIPLRQGSGEGQSFQVRTRLGPGALANALVRIVKSIDENLATGEITTMREEVDRRSWSQRAAVTLLMIFGSIALLLAGIGLYGAMSYAISQNTRELGLRMAVGASISDLLRMVMSHGLALTFAGISVGAALALEVTRLFGDMLYQVSPHDPISFFVAAVVMTVLAVAASFFPARRAARIDPVRALRDS